MRLPFGSLSFLPFFQLLMNMNTKIHIHGYLAGVGALLLCAVLSGCQWFEQKRMTGVAVALNGQYLYQSTLDSLSFGLSSEDSARVVELYLKQWAKDILVYEKAKGAADKTIEALVEDYRRSLYVHAFEQELVERRMPKQVADSVIEQIYAAHPEKFELRESIAKGVLIVVPNGAPNMKKLRGWLTDLSEENLENIEKFAYNYAVGYELFTDQWRTAQQLLLTMPFEQDELDRLLRSKQQIELQDSLSTYILQVTDKQMAGEPMPIEYARPEIEKAVLSQRRVLFLQKERERLYEDALRHKKIQFFESH